MDDNKNRYLELINGFQDTDERRMTRRKKRQKARILAYVSLAVVLLLAGTGIFFVIKHTGLMLKAGRTDVAEENRNVQNHIEDILGGEEEVVVAPPVVTDPEPTEEELFDEWLDSKIAVIPLEEKVMNLFIVRPESITGVDIVIQAGEGTQKAFEQYTVGGVLYSDKNILSADQFSGMLANTRSYSKYPLFLAVKEEPGNTVLGNKLKLDATLSQAKIGESMDPYTAYTEHKKIAEYLKASGIDFNFGIVSDIIDNKDDTSLFMSSRSFGADPVIVSRMVQESAHAYSESGISTAVGYFPGQGSLKDDPTKGVLSVMLTADDVYTKQYEVLKAAVDNGAVAVVVSHEYADNIVKDNVPCSLSKDIYTGLLRDSYGFSNVILITDCLDDPVITEYYTSAESCVKAIKAGADMVLCPENFEEGYEAVVEAVKSNVISEDRINDSLKRVFRVKYRSEYEEKADENGK